MPGELVAVDLSHSAQAYAQLLLNLHELIQQGKGDCDEAEAVADEMDAPWYAMTEKEQDRMRGLAADLNTLREGAPKRVEMGPGQLAQWRHEASDAGFSL